MNPEERREFATDPYSGLSRFNSWHVMGEPSDRTCYDHFSAAIGILASEPIGAYEETFPGRESGRLSPKDTRFDQRSFLVKELAISSGLVDRFKTLVLERDFCAWEHSASELYKTITKAVFGTEDSGEIEKLYSQRQRRSVRCAAAAFVDQVEKMRAGYEKLMARNSPTGPVVLKRSEISNLVDVKFYGTEDFEALFSPIGITLYLPPAVYSAFEREMGARNEMWVVSSNNATPLFTSFKLPIFIIEKKFASTEAGKAALNTQYEAAFF